MSIIVPEDLATKKRAAWAEWKVLEAAPNPKLTQAFIGAIVAASTVEIIKIGPKTTVVQLTLPNGFAITESSSCVDPANYNEDLGLEYAMKRIEPKIWELYGFHLQQTRAGWMGGPVE